MTRAERLNNPTHNFKSELQHIEHTMQRLKDRHGIEISLDEYYNLLNLVQTKSDDLYRLNSSNSVKRVIFKGQEIWLIYGCGSSFRQTHIPARIKTILQESFTSYPVPDKYGMEIKGERLANDVRSIIAEIKRFRTNVMPYITKKELFVEPDFDYLDKVFKSVSEKLYHGKLTENDLYRGAFKIAFNQYDNMWIGRDSNPRTPKRTDLQSVAFNHSATNPLV